MKRLHLSLLCCCVVLAGCGEHKTTTAAQSPSPLVATPNASPLATPPAPTPSPTSMIPEVIIHAHRHGGAPVSITVTKAERRLYTIDADANETERTAAGTYFSTFAAPQVVFFNRDGSTMRASATKAEVDGTSKIVTMLGHVVLHAQDGTVLRCDRLTYDDRNDHVESWSEVVVTTPQGDTLRGEHLDGDLRLKHVRIDGAQGTP